MSPVGRPQVTIGLPVYNGEATLTAVLESILAQTCKDFKVIIADNASSDTTETICREFEGRDARITYIRQPQNIGAEANFEFVLTAADTKYFLWAAADDVRSSDFLEKNIEFLDSHPDFIASTCPVRFEGGVFDPIEAGDQTCDNADPIERILQFLETWHANGRMYSLFRSDALRDLKVTDYRYFGGDWTLIIDLLAKGKFNRLESGSVERGRKGASNRLDIFAMYKRGIVRLLVPFWDMSWKTMKQFGNARFRQKLRLIRLLMRLNGYAFRGQIKFAMRRRRLMRRGTPAASSI